MYFLDFYSATGIGATAWEALETLHILRLCLAMLCWGFLNMGAGMAVSNQHEFLPFQCMLMV